jgi:hypothetical protein
MRKLIVAITLSTPAMAESDYWTKPTTEDQKAAILSVAMSIVADKYCGRLAADPRATARRLSDVGFTEE